MDYYEYADIVDFLTHDLLDTEWSDPTNYKGRSANFVVKQGKLYEKGTDKTVILKSDLDRILFDVHARNDLKSYTRNSNELFFLRQNELKPCEFTELKVYHLNFDQTLQILKDNYYWPIKFNMEKHVQDFIFNCPVCNQKMTRDDLKKFDLFSVDILGPFAESKDGMRYLVVTTENFSQYVVIQPLKNNDYLSVAKYIIREVVIMGGAFKYLETNQNSEFNSKLINTLKFCVMYPGNKEEVISNERFGLYLYNSMLKNRKMLWNEYIFSLVREFRKLEIGPHGVTPNLRFLGRNIFEEDEY